MTNIPEAEHLPHESTLIIGAGIAGLFTALKMAPAPVVLITAAQLGTGGASTWAQGGLAAAMGEDDTPDLHYMDTVKAGGGLVDEPAARILVEEGPDRVNDLIALGVQFDKDEDGKLLLGKEAAHSRNRIVHATGDQAGKAIMEALVKAAKAADHITIRERVVAEDLLFTDREEIYGALVYDIEKQERIILTCPRTVLATGGVGGLFSITTNPKHAQGHGLAMAFRAGVEIMDPEFVQFHPTALDVGLDPAPLATEALRGEGARIIDRDGKQIMHGVHIDGDLAPRDVVARAVSASIAAGRGALLDSTSAIGKAFPEKFPAVYEACQNVGLDPVKDAVPIAPAAHYHMGGVRTDENARTSRTGLWAVGEIANTGVHGANRLASNSLLEALVYGARAAHDLKNNKREKPDAQLGFGTMFLNMPPEPATEDEMTVLRHLMSTCCGMSRNADAIKEALGFIFDCLHGLEMTSGYHNALVAASIILGSANNRMESRGSHQRQDFPNTGTPQHGIMWLLPNSHQPQLRTEGVKRISYQEGSA